MGILSHEGGSYLGAGYPESPLEINNSCSFLRTLLPCVAYTYVESSGSNSVVFGKKAAPELDAVAEMEFEHLQAKDEAGPEIFTRA